MADIVDPHELKLADSLPKLQGLALYAQAQGNSYRRIESVAQAIGKLRVLDLCNEQARPAIASASDAASLFGSSLARGC